MIKDFINRYGQLSDSIIKEVNFITLFKDNEEINLIKIKIYCSKIDSDFDYETVELHFNDIVSLSFNIDKDFLLFSPSDVLIEYNENDILFEFDPLDYLQYLKVNPNSSFQIRSRFFEFKEL
ncbi:hypothetical protein [Flavobacterium sp.]|uniref:hypothetical protein n=1 Tax=Flavobacterium sp. TaxID=239 RepID=UPI00262269DE|nr:hypothetical protein [Flavobacterium sp.]